MTTTLGAPPTELPTPHSAPTPLHREPAGEGAERVEVETDHVHPPADPPPSRPRLTAALFGGREGDPSWVRPSVLALLTGTALLYLWGLGASGWANGYYSAAVQAGTQSWKAMFFGSLDSANSITVDKSPLFLWPMVISARIFGVNSWSILVPQALMGVGSVGVLYLTVRRWFGAPAGLLAGAVLALTPVAALMFRFNNPDAMLVLLMTLGAYATVRAIESGNTKWLIAMGAFVGFAFLAKMLQALLVLPGFGLAYLVAGPPQMLKRIWQLGLAGVSTIVAAGWWVAIVELWPAGSRPYIGGSQTNSVLELIFGYNGFGRLSGNETGSVGGMGGGNGTGQWGATGIGRLFNSSFGANISWLLPAALVLMGAVLYFSRRTPRTGRARASMILWGGWLLVTGAAISFGQGIIHEYYTVALAPAIGAIVGTGLVMVWRRRETYSGRVFAVATVVVTTVWTWVLLGRVDWQPWLRWLVLIAGLGSAVLIGAWPIVRRHHRLVQFTAAAMLVALLAGPAAYSVATAATAHTGALPSAGPSGTGGGGPGGGPGGPGGGIPGGTGGGFGPGGAGGPTATGNGAPTGGGGPGGILSTSESSAELTAALQSDSDRYRWVAATISANQAAGYQLASEEPVMAIGGFNGTDPSPTLAEFQQYVENGDIHYFIAGNGGAGPGGGANGTASAITTWVAEHFDTVTVDGTTLYDLTSPLASTDG